MFIKAEVFKEADTIDMKGETKTYDLGNYGILSAIDIKARFTADTGQIDASKERPEDYLSEIQLICDDEFIPFQLDGKQVNAAYFYDHKRVPPHFISNVNNAVNEQWFRILLGDYIGDEDKALDLAAFSKTELNITNLDSDTGNFFDIGTYDIILYWIKESAKVPRKLVQRKVIKDWTPRYVDDKHKEALDHKLILRRLMVQVLPTYQARTSDLVAEWNTVLKRLKYTYDKGDVVVFDADPMIQAWLNMYTFGRALVTGVIDGTNGDYLDSGLGYVLSVVSGLNEGVANPDTGATGQSGLAYRTNQKVLYVQGTTLADVQLNYRLQGIAYNGTVVWDYKDSPLVVDRRKEVELLLQAGDTNGKVRIITEGIKSY